MGGEGVLWDVGGEDRSRAHDLQIYDVSNQGHLSMMYLELK